MGQFDTAASILNDAAAELALQTADVAAASIYASTEPHLVLLMRLLKGLGQDLARQHPWSHLEKIHTFSTANGTDSYALPTDFARLKDQTEWNRSSQLQLLGPASGVGWQYLKALSSTASVNQVFRIFGNKVYIHPTPSSIETVAYEYISDLWVMPSGQTTPTIAAPTAGTDTLWFDRRLLVAGLKWRYLAEKSLPSQHALADFQSALGAATGGDGAAPILTLDGRGPSGHRLIDEYNLPGSGVGS